MLHSNLPPPWHNPRPQHPGAASLQKKHPSGREKGERRRPPRALRMHVGESSPHAPPSVADAQSQRKRDNRRRNGRAHLQARDGRRGRRRRQCQQQRRYRVSASEGRVSRRSAVLRVQQVPSLTTGASWQNNAFQPPGSRFPAHSRGGRR